MQNTTLSQKLKDIRKRIPFEKILGREAEDTSTIAKYYRLNRLAYRLINSKHGFVHMGISRDGVFKESDFTEHATFISGYIGALTATQVLELAAGKAATTKYLAKQHPATAFVGLDLPRGQLDTHQKTLPNVRLVEGDYHNLSQFNANSFDVVYIIEALCHASSKEKVIQQVKRILKPRGVFIIFDGYEAKDPVHMTDEERLVSNLTYKSMMVTQNDHVYTLFRQHLLTAGFKIVHEEDLSKYVLPSMRRLEQKAAKYFKNPLLAYLLNTLLPIEVTGNAVAAYLMPLSVEMGLHQYWVTVVQK